MHADDLLRLLDLKDVRAGPDEGPALSLSDPAGTTVDSGSTTVFEVDGWGLRRGEDLLAETDRLKSLSLDTFAVADCHTAAFDPEPRLRSDGRDKLRREFFGALLETPEYRSLHRLTRLDAVASEIAAIHFAEELAAFRKEAEAAAEDMQREVASLRAASRASLAAQEEVAECREAQMALGMGPGYPGSNDAKTIAELFRRVRNDSTLRAICSLAGRYRRFAQSRQRRKTRHGLDDVVGVELAGDLGRLVPHELAKLADPSLEKEALRRMVERQLMAREYHASEPVAQGPIIVCVDESGSMHGEPVHTAKAIALALAWIARRQRRWCALIAYSGDSGERLLPLPAGRWNELALADWLMAFLGRGSNLDIPIRELPRMFGELKAPAGDTDVIALTDCCCHIPRDLQENFNSWKRSVQARLITLAIGEDAGDVAAVSDEIHLVRSLAVSEDAVARVLSI
jgi:uncharacterized protein with von Willebrand factor type A (vWA) domain